jgi:type II secretory pathway pseudopilin PulG
VRLGSPLARPRHPEDGQSLIEVVAAISALIIILVPALLLVTRSTQSVYNNQYKVTAANLANGQLEMDRNQSVAQQTVTLNPPTSPVTVGTESYTIVQTSGWCTPPATSAGSWTTYLSGSSYSYGVRVTVTWKEDQTGVQVAGLLTTPSGTSAATGTSCPL